MVFASGTRKAVFMIIAGLFTFSNSETDIEKQECLGVDVKSCNGDICYDTFFL